MSHESLFKILTSSGAVPGNPHLVFHLAFRGKRVSNKSRAYGHEGPSKKLMEPCRF